MTLAADSRALPASLLSFLKRRWRGLLLGVLVAALAWTALIGAWLPGWLRPRIEAAASEALGTPVTLQHLAVQPWTLRVTAEGLRIAAPGAAPAAAAGAPALAQLTRAEAQLSLQSLWRLAPVLRRLTLTEPVLHIERSGPGRFNFSPILDRLAARPPTPADAEPARFALYNIRIEGGALDYEDQVLGQRHRVEALRLGVPHLSNLPSDLDADVLPLLEARVDGSELKLSGETKPFAPGRPTDFDLQWRGVKLAEWGAALRPLLPPQARVDVAQGTLDADLTLRFQARPGQVARLSVQGRVGVQGLDARWPVGGWAGRWTSLVIDGLDLAPLERRAQVGALTLDGVEVTQSTPQTAEVAPDRPAPPAAPVSAAAPPPAVSPPWTWSLAKLQVNAKTVRLQAPGGQAALPTLGPLTLAVEGLASDPRAAPARLALTAADALGSRLQVQGTLRPAVPSAALQATLADAALAPWLQALALPMPLQVSAGRLGLQLQLQADAQALVVSDGTLRLQGFKSGLPGRAEVADHVHIADLQSQGLAARVALPGGPGPAGLQRLTLASLALDQLDLAASRDAQARWRVVPAPASSKPAAPAALRASAQATTADPALVAHPVIDLRALRCSACKIAVQDETVSPAARFVLTGLQLGVDGVSNDLSRPLAVSLSSQAQGAGQVSFKGSVTPQPLKVDARLGVKALDLRALQPYLAPRLNLTLAAAQANAEGQLAVATSAAQALNGTSAAQALSVRYQGRAGLTDLRTQDSVTGNDFVRWRALALDGLGVAWQQDGTLDADLGRVSLDDFYGRVIVHPDGHLNLADVRKREAGAPAQSLTTPQTAVTPATPAAPPRSTPAPRLRWQRIALTNGRVDFTDNFIKPNYSARLGKLVGQVSASGSDATAPAQVQVSGALDDGAPISLTGRVQPLGAQLFVDLEGTAKGIELPRLSAYAERYAGYAIERGSLSLTVHYKLDQGRLEASNRLFLDQLTFGDKVDSPSATQLPVLLAVSLLKNSRGEIDVDLPVAGSLDDPEFSVGGVILRVLGNLLTKAVTAPFALLAGSDHAELGYVPFEPGSAQLSPATRERLDALATRLRDRPALKLDATGRADPAVDVPGLRQRHVQRLMRQAKAAATGQAASEVTIGADERERWLQAAYQAAEIKKPRNVIGLAKTLPPAEMEALLMADADTSPAALMTLANRRADQVNAYLDGKLAADRVQLTRSVVGTQGLAQDQGPSTRVQFELR